MTDTDERAAITAAMQRLLAGKPLRSSGELTIVALAAEADLKRNKLTHKHTDLKDLFYAEVRARDGIPDGERKLREELAVLRAQIQDLCQERDDYRRASEVFARAINVLTIENDQLRMALDKQSPTALRLLRSLD
ncbi:hypothetical protein AB0C69_15870 [Actinomadura sp. NPDC048032]|uniref:hypothetical protein n=1 Tax=Actinomadura sp. NPDC048032 TaxID=3155747 RepID=UPI00340A007E